MAKQKKTRVLLFVGTEHNVGRHFIKGVFRYSNFYGSWDFFSPLPYYITPRNQQSLISDIKKWKPNGAIIFEQEKSVPIKEILGLNIPAILSFKARGAIPNYPIILSDCAAIGSMGADYFLDLGFRNYAFCGCKHFTWSEDRHKAFSEKVTKAGYNSDYHDITCTSTEHPWEQEQKFLKKWLNGLKKPVGLMACNDDFARIILTICQATGILVPEQVAILGADNDKQSCEICKPKLSSVNVSFENTGYQSAQLIQSLVNGEKMTGQKILAMPTHIEVRGSTDIISTEDEHVAAAVRFIRENATKPIQVDDIVNEICIHRRTLEKRFKKVIGLSIYKYIRRTNANKMSKILLNSNLPLSKIAYQLGLNEKLISRWFKAEKGMSPSAYREKFGHS